MVVLPFEIIIPGDALLTIWGYQDRDHVVHVYPPAATDLPATGDGFDELAINDRPAIRANALQLEFHRESFNRKRPGPGELPQCEPTEEDINRALAWFTERFRHVTRAPIARHFTLADVTSWRLTYLDDEGQGLELDESLSRERSGFKHYLSVAMLDETIWDNVLSLPSDYELPPWEDLLLEAEWELPRIGPAVVLAWTGLEVFIAATLDLLVPTGERSLWEWIGERKFRQPTVKDKFTSLLKHFTEHSLMDEAAIWQSFTALQRARHTFVHTGVAEDAKSKTPLSSGQAGELVRSARDIIEQINEWLPAGIQWPVMPKHALELRMRVALDGRSDEGLPDASDDEVPSVED